MGKIVFTKGNATFLGICLTGLAIIVLAFMLPLLNEKAKIADDIQIQRAKIAEQSQLEEIVKTLDQKLEALGKNPVIPIVERAPLESEQSGQVIYDLRELAERHHIQVDAIDPFVSRMSDHWNILQVAANFTGSGNNFRTFLLDLLKLPYVNRINTLNFISAEDTLKIEMLFAIDIQ